MKDLQGGQQELELAFPLSTSHERVLKSKWNKYYFKIELP